MYTTDVHEVWVGGGSGLATVVLLDDAWPPAPPEPPGDEPLELLDPLEPQPATASRPITASTTATIVRLSPAGAPNRRVEQH